MSAVHELLQKWDMYDLAITGHGFTEYNRDYRIIVDFMGWDKVEHFVEFLFRGCVEAHYESAAYHSSYLTDDTFIDAAQWEVAGKPDGLVWGFNLADFTEWTYSKESEQARIWSQKVGLPMHEFVLDTNLYKLRFIFHDLSVTPLEDRAAGRSNA